MERKNTKHVFIFNQDRIVGGDTKAIFFQIWKSTSTLRFLQVSDIYCWCTHSSKGWEPEINFTYKIEIVMILKNHIWQNSLNPYREKKQTPNVMNENRMSIGRGGGGGGGIRLSTPT